MPAFLSSVAKAIGGAVKSVGSFLGSSAGSTLGNILSPVAGIAGSLLGWQGGKDANQAASAQALRQMQFQERMADTAWQRGMADMRAAGLNPMLAISQGAAHSPGGAMAQVRNVGADAADVGQKFSSSAIGFRKMKSELDALNAQANNANASAGLNTAQSGQIAALLPEQLKRARAEANSAVAISQAEEIQRDVMRQQAQHLKDNPWMLILDNYNRLLRGTAGSLGSSAKAIGNTIPMSFTLRR